ncbi:MAG TPA: alpha/beta hydrolase-fold protein [Gammaproteobacteria bacterium]|nr:alpha/beta hydrolase-fold protein [Gammaproteobacteria bacterium]
MRRVDRWAVSVTLCVLASVAAHAQAPPARPAAPPRVVSPEVAADGKVTFRLRAPQAQSVRLTSGGDIPQIPPNQTLELQKGGDGVWQLTIGPVDPGAYRYAFVVDSVNVVDPAQPNVSGSNDNVWSLFTVPGAKFMDTLDVPHGTVAEVRYHSAALGRWRSMHVYSPPGYGLKAQRYPVLYLLHGAFDSDDSWPTVGRAADIVDNLIAERAAVPMIVVMPAGHTGPFTLNAAAGAGGLPIDEFVKDFQRDIKPYVESHYTVRTDRKSTAIAGLSMGGAQTLEIAIQNLQDYGYVGVFSSGVFSAPQSDEWAQRYAKQLDDPHAKAGLDVLWFATGADDFLLPTTKATVGLFEKHGFKPVFVQSTGAHTWINWRNYLHEFAPQLFK